MFHNFGPRVPINKCTNPRRKTNEHNSQRLESWTCLTIRNLVALKLEHLNIDDCPKRIICKYGRLQYTASAQKWSTNVKYKLDRFFFLFLFFRNWSSPISNTEKRPKKMALLPHGPQLKSHKSESYPSAKVGQNEYSYHPSPSTSSDGLLLPETDILPWSNSTV